MSVNVSWLIDSTVAAKLVYAKNEDSLKKQLTGLNLITDLRTCGNLRAGDLVLIDYSLVKKMDERNAKSFFDTLADHECACAGVLNVGQLSRSSDFCKTAERYDFPVISFGRQYSLSDIADNLFRGILTSEMDVRKETQPKTRKKDAPNDINTFVEQVLLEPGDNPQNVKMLCHLYGFDISTPRICFVIQPELLENTSTQQIKRVHSMIWDAMDKAFADEPLKSFRLQYYNNLILFTFDDSYRLQSKALDSAKHLALETAKTLLNTDIRCHIGISKAYTGWDTIHTCFTQSLKALELGNSIHPEWTVYSYRDDDVYQFLINNLSREKLVSFYNESIRPLAEYDKENNTDMLSTLHMFFECGRSLSKTAENLYIHRNTMLYRMDRIQQILDVDLKKTNESFRIQLGLYIMHLIQCMD